LKGLFEVTDTGDRWPVGEAELEWLAANDVEAFVAGWPADLPINILGGHAHHLAQRLALRTPKRQVEAHPLRPPKSDFDHFHDVDLPVLDPGRIANELTPRGSTVVLDPILGHWLVENPDVLESVALKTFDRLLFPAFVKPLSWQLFFSDEFSFEEPVGDDSATHRWCWSVSDKPATVFIQSGEILSDHRLKFSVTCTSPGMFICRVGDELQAGEATADKLSVEFSFLLHQRTSLVAVEITFTGKPLAPNDPLDQRKALYFSYSGTSIEHLGFQLLHSEAIPAPNAVSFLADRSVRRTLHARGFFEVQTLATPWIGLSSLRGVRSCYDYRCGFSYRDTDPLASAPLGGARATYYGFPAIWYQARRMPSPGIEWTDTKDRFASALTAAAG
jgi:hypothetical protein